MKNEQVAAAMASAHWESEADRKFAADYVAELEARVPATVEARIPPQDIACEQSILGTVLMYPLAERVFSVVQPEDFYREAHRDIARAMLDIHKRREPVDMVTVGAELKGRGKFDECGGAQYITTLTGAPPTAAHVMVYAAKVRDLAVVRSMITLGHELMEQAYEGAQDPSPLIEQIHAKTNEWEERIRKRGRVSHMSEMVGTGDRLRAFIVEQANWRETRPHFGIEDFDAWMRGLPTPGLTVAKGAPGSGKSVLANQLIYWWTHKCGRPGLLASLEMAFHEQTLPRLIRMHTGIDVEKVTTEEEMEEVMLAQEDILQADFTHVDAIGMTGPDIISQIRQVHSQRGITVAVVDYIQRIAVGNQHKEAAFTGFADALKNLAHELRIACMLCSQVTVTDDGGEVSKWSKAIEEVADAVIHIKREGNTRYDERANPQALLVLEKSRNGPVGLTDVILDPANLMWKPFDPRDDEPPEERRDARHGT